MNAYYEFGEKVTQLINFGPRLPFGEVMAEANKIASDLGIEITQTHKNHIDRWFNASEMERRKESEDCLIKALYNKSTGRGTAHDDELIAVLVKQLGSEQ